MSDESNNDLELADTHSAKWWGWASVLAFGVSLMTPAFCLVDRCVPGYEALLSGWIHVLFQPQVGLCWFASPILMFAWLCLYGSGRGPAIFFASVALILAASFLFAHGVVTGEDGTPHPVLLYHVGYWA